MAPKIVLRGDCFYRDSITPRVRDGFWRQP